MLIVLIFLIILFTKWRVSVKETCNRRGSQTPFIHSFNAGVTIHYGFWLINTVNVKIQVWIIKPRSFWKLPDSVQVNFSHAWKNTAPTIIWIGTLLWCSMFQCRRHWQKKKMGCLATKLVPGLNFAETQYNIICQGAVVARFKHTFLVDYFTGNFTKMICTNKEKLCSGMVSGSAWNSWTWYSKLTSWIVCHCLTST